jgi:hypothetical protein
VKSTFAHPHTGFVSQGSETGLGWIFCDERAPRAGRAGIDFRELLQLTATSARIRQEFRSKFNNTLIMQVTPAMLLF